MKFMDIFNKEKPLTKASTSEVVVTLHITDTGRLWVDPNEVVKTKAFQIQREAVKRLRQAKEKAAAVQESAVT